MTSRIAIIPARGGSTRLPRKNILPLGGRPLIAWTIQAAQESGLFDRVIVSTDDEEIAAVAREWNSSVPFLRDRHADHHSPSSLATLAALEQSEQYWGEHYDVIAQLLPTCPLREGEHICKAMSSFDNASASAQISVFEFGWMNPWWAAKRQPDGKPTWLFPDARMERSQDLEKLHCPTGAIWLADADALRESKSFYTPDHSIEAIPWQAAVDIDTEQDLRMAELLMLMREKS